MDPLHSSDNQIQRKPAADGAGQEMSGPVTTQSPDLPGPPADPLAKLNPPPLQFSLTANRNDTGLPDDLKAGVESLSREDLSDVRVHYNSSEPAQFQAEAFAKGNEIHLGPGREQHLAHEAWHVVQQKQGRVPVTSTQFKTALNDDPGLEQEADEKGKEAMDLGFSAKEGNFSQGEEPPTLNKSIPAPFLPIIQRRVGFEMEDKSWKPWIKRFGHATRAADRKEVLHQGTGFRLEGDDTPGDGTANIEFVTDAFQTNAGGVGALNTAMHEIIGIYQRLNHFVDDNNKTKTVAGRRVVRPGQAGVNNNHVYMSGGKQDGSIKLQMTFGARLEDFPTLFKYMGMGVPGETPVEGGEREDARQMVYGPANYGPPVAPRPNRKRTGTIGQLVGRAPDLANQVIAHMLGIAGMGAAHLAALGGNTAKLQGFLSILMIYLKGLQLPMALIKYRVPFLGRSNMAAIFQDLPANQRAVLSHNNAQYLKASMLAISNANMILDYDGHGFFVDNNLNANTPLMRNKPDLATMTIGQWMQGITGAPGIDYLFKANMEAWLVAQGRTAAQADTQSEPLESMSMLNDQEGGMDAGLAVFENRAIQPGEITPLGAIDMTIQDAHKYTLDFLTFLTTINAGAAGAAPGAYPNLIPPVPPPAPAAAGGGCYITTACAVAMGLPDDCEQLTVLRQFRDHYLLKTPVGPYLVEIYYADAPRIVEAINRLSDPGLAYRAIFPVVQYCVELIKRREEDLACRMYIDMVMGLKKIFLSRM